MSIIIKNSQLNAETIEALNQLIEMDINASSAFKLTRILKEISSIVEDKLKAEKRILEKYTEKDVDGHLVRQCARRHYQLSLPQHRCTYFNSLFSAHPPFQTAAVPLQPVLRLLLQRHSGGRMESATCFIGTCA